MKGALRLLLAAFAALLLFGAPVATGDSGNKYPPKTQVVECFDDAHEGPVGTITAQGPTDLWPPNHKPVTITITATSTDDGDEATLSGLNTHDQMVSENGEVQDNNGDGEADGSGSTPFTSDADPMVYGPNEGTPSASQAIAVRSERAGTEKDGRTYTLSWNATFSDSETPPDGSVLDTDDVSPTTEECSGEFTVHAAHDQRGGAGWRDEE